MEKRIFLFTLFLMILLPLLTVAQLPGITITTSPPGAEIVLEGDAIFSGVSPVVFRHGLTGRYQVRIVRPGYENYSTSVMLDPTQPFALNVKLAPKTRFKATVRSMVFPGWGQKYTDQGSKGFLFQLSIIGAGLTYLITDHDFQAKYDDYQNARLAYFASNTVEEKQRLWSKYADAQKIAYDAEGPRRFALQLTAGLWALNVLDALLFFPDNSETLSYKGVTLLPEIENQRVGLALTAKF